MTMGKRCGWTSFDLQKEAVGARAGGGWVRLIKKSTISLCCFGWQSYCAGR